MLLSPPILYVPYDTQRWLSDLGRARIIRPIKTEGLPDNGWPLSYCPQHWQLSSPSVYLCL